MCLYSSFVDWLIYVVCCSPKYIFMHSRMCRDFIVSSNNSVVISARHLLELYSEPVRLLMYAVLDIYEVHVHVVYSVINP